MIRRITRWLRVVLPPAWALVAVLLVYGLFESLHFWWIWWAGLGVAETGILEVRNGVFAALCAAYGVFRAAAFHPAFRQEYFNWLDRTPWTSRRPLPAGPIHLAPQDAVVLAAAVLLLHDFPARLVVAPSAFLCGYLGCLSASFWPTGQRWFGYLLFFGLGLAACATHRPWAALAVLAALYLPAYVGLRRALAQFPWERSPWWEALRKQFEIRKAKERSIGLGWPFDHLRPKPTPRYLDHLDYVLISLLAGWWLYALGSNLQHGDEQSMLLVAHGYTTIGCVVGRLVTYCRRHWPPISLWGRIWTLRWIIPGYDQVLIAPICAALTGILCPWGLSTLELPLGVCVPVSLSLVLLVTLCVPPTLGGWQCTGNHRIAAALTKSQEFVRI